MKSPPLICVFAFLLVVGPVYSQQISTHGDQSPAVWASSVSIAYGFSHKHIIQLEAVFKQHGLSPAERKKRVVHLVNNIRSGMEKEAAPKPSLEQIRQWLGADADDEVMRIFSTGNQSPVVLGKKARITYGLSEQEFWGLYTYFEKNQAHLDLKNRRIAQQGNVLQTQQAELAQIDEAFRALLQRFQELEKELAFRTDDMAQEARKLLQEGKIGEAVKVLEDRYYFTVKRDERAQKERALAAYDYAQGLTFDPTNYRLATSIYADAVAQDPENTKFINAYGYMLLEMGKYEEAIPIFQRAIKLDSLANGGRDTSVAFLYNNFGGTLGSKGQYDRAIEYFELALGIDTPALGISHPTVATVFNNLGATWLSKGHYDQAIVYFKRAFGIDSTVLGPKHHSVAKDYSNLGTAWYGKGQYDRAVDYFELALGIDTLILGTNHPTVASIYNNLGGAWLAKGWYKRAISYFELVLGIDTTVFGLDHPNVAKTFNNLGTAWMYVWENDKAISYFEQALRIDTLFFGRFHPNVAGIYSNLASALTSKGNYDLCIHYYELAISIETATVGTTHPSLARTYNYLGQAWEIKGEYDTALTYYERALGIDTVALGKNHPMVAKDYNSMGNAWMRKGDYDKCIFYYERALAIDTVALGINHHMVASIHNNLGNAWHYKGKYSRSITYFERAIAILYRIFPRNHPNMRMSHRHISLPLHAKGWKFFELTEYEKALSYFLRSIQHARKGDPTSTFISALNNAGLCYKILGKYDSALVYLDEGIELAEKLNQAVEKQLEAFPDSQKNHPDFPAYREQNLHYAVLRRLYFHKASTLLRMKRKKEAKVIFRTLKEAATKREDQAFLDEIAQEEKWKA
ncbi:MAG: tetratricopeptide repeat protein [Bacteroidota bacterium]